MRNYLRHVNMLGLFAVLTIDAQAAIVSHSEHSVDIIDTSYKMKIALDSFKFSFSDADGTVIAAAHASSGIKLNGFDAVSSTYDSETSGSNELRFNVSFSDDSQATVVVYPSDDAIRISVLPLSSNQAHKITLHADFKRGWAILWFSG